MRSSTLCILFLLLYSCSPAVSPYCRFLHVRPEGISSHPRSYLGVLMKPVRLEAHSGCEWFIQVAGVLNGSPAMKAGIKRSDIILSMDDVRVCDNGPHVINNLRKMIEAKGSGSEARIEVRRGEKRLYISVELRGLPLVPHEEASHDSEECDERLSMLEESLRRDGMLKHYQDILSGLYIQSNMPHNPEWLSEVSDNPYQLREFTYMLRHPLRSGERARAITGGLSNSSLGAVVRDITGLLDINITKGYSCKGLTFPGLMDVMSVAVVQIEDALKGLTPEERNRLFRGAIEPWERDDWNSMLETTLRFDRNAMMNAIYPLINCLTPENIYNLKRDIAKRFQNSDGDILYDSEGPFGRILIGGTGANTYREDAALILDLGGDDLYLNNAGGSREGMPLAIVIDWKGDDNYLTKEDFSQGAGVLGGGFLIDLEGNDIFKAQDASQGVGLFGIGLLLKRGGKNIFKSRSFSQGVGEAGIGIVLNNDSDTFYHSGQYAQGLGLFGGAGVLIDQGGNDSYTLGGLTPDPHDPEDSTQSMGQGFAMGIRPLDGILGVSGGVGVLIDTVGDDVYETDYFAQGASYYYGIGIMRDISGDDRYIAGRYAQGAGIHSSIGVLMDDMGNDLYYASYGVAQGMGHDHGIGYLEDMDGDNRFSAGILSQGACTEGGMGIMVEPKNKGHFNTSKGKVSYSDNDSCLTVEVEPR